MKNSIWRKGNASDQSKPPNSVTPLRIHQERQQKRHSGSDDLAAKRWRKSLLLAGATAQSDWRAEPNPENKFLSHPKTTLVRVSSYKASGGRQGAAQHQSRRMKEEEEEKNLCKGCMLFSFFLLNTGTLPLFADGFFAFTKKKRLWFWTYAVTQAASEPSHHVI